jgi:iron complex transport system substrate-binding protein
MARGASSRRSISRAAVGLPIAALLWIGSVPTTLADDHFPNSPGQLVSVSHVARDPASSVLHEEATDYPINHARAEEIHALQPDLVLAGAYSSSATVDLVRRLGIRVESFSPETTFDDIRANVARMGAILGRQQRAEAIIADMDRALDAIVEPHDETRLSVAIYEPNGYTSGSGTLADAVIRAAGLVNIADRLGASTGTVHLPLEMLVAARADIVVADRRDRGAPALAEANFDHPAFRAIAGDSEALSIEGKYWSCGGPFTAEAVGALADAARVVRDKARP